MAAGNGAVRIAAATEPANAETLAAFLLLVEAQERTGLSPRLAILAAATEHGADPADVLRRTGEAAD